MALRENQETRPYARRLPIGAEVVLGGGAHFRVWAPRCARVELILQDNKGGENNAVALDRDEAGYFTGPAPEARAGMRYCFRLDGADKLVPDPASRFQPEGPHGSSEIVDPAQFSWSDSGWRGVELPGQVLYEMHVGTFTREGTWAAAERHLEQLQEIGVTVIEMMPLNDFVGRFGWGYDGVDLFAPTRLYGRPDDLRRFIDRAHGLGMGVILDVVYNHLGPDGNYLKLFSEDYFSTKYKTDWGEPLNYDGKNSGPVREFFISNAGYWIDEFHFDGLRLDATDNIYDSSPKHVIADICERIRESAGRRSTILIAENERQDVNLLCSPELNGCGLDAVWNDDFHHSTRVALTGQREAYYTDYRGSAQELISAVKWGYLYQGQWYGWQKKRRGSSTRGIEPWRFVNYLDNHDQISNSGFGERIHSVSQPGCYRAITALLLLSPGTPMLFQGQEFGASSRFTYFADHNPELAKLVHQGRLEFVAQFPTLARPESQECIADPRALATFEMCKLNHDECVPDGRIYRLHRDLLRLRRTDAVFSAQGAMGFDGAVIGPKTLALRFYGHDSDRLLLVNLDVDYDFDPAPEPLIGVSQDQSWTVLWSSEYPRYGGRGILEPPAEGKWIIQGYSAMVLTSEKSASATHQNQGAGNSYG